MLTNVLKLRESVDNRKFLTVRYDQIKEKLPPGSLGLEVLLASGFELRRDSTTGESSILSFPEGGFNELEPLLRHNLQRFEHHRREYQSVCSANPHFAAFGKLFCECDSALAIVEQQLLQSADVDVDVLTRDDPGANSPETTHRVRLLLSKSLRAQANMKCAHYCTFSVSISLQC